MDIMREIRKKAKTEEIDYLFLMNCLSSYKQPRDKLTKLLKKKHLIRIKKGIYIFGEEYRKRPYSLEVLANLIYGPSYISFEYALSYYNLIPEKVVSITSACTRKYKHFSTPVGEFVYYYISRSIYPLGIALESIDEHTHFLIATKEKAITDYIARIKPFETKGDLFEFLTEGMRIDQKDIFSLRLSLIKEISANYKNKNIDLLCQILKK